MNLSESISYFPSNFPNKYQNFVAPKISLEACKGMNYSKVSNVRLNDENKCGCTPVDFDVYNSSIPEQVPDHQVMFLS